MSVSQAWGLTESNGHIKPMTVHRRPLQPKDIRFEISYCGICHSDIHMATGGWGERKFPMVPGHEFVGRVVAIGPEVTKHKIGDLVGVTPICHSCMTCHECEEEGEQFCLKRVETYADKDPYIDDLTYGGYSSDYVVDEHFAVPIPSGLDEAKVAPLLCAGITSWGALRHLNVRQGFKLGVVGFGGLGHLCVQMANKMGAEVYVFTRDEGKKGDIMACGATKLVHAVSEKEMKSMEGTLDGFVDFVSSLHDTDKFIKTLKVGGTFCLTGMPDGKMGFNMQLFQMNRRYLIGTYIDSIAECAKMLKFCELHGVEAMTELVMPEQIEAMWDRLRKGTVRYRAVVDMRRVSHRQQQQNRDANRTDNQLVN
eukprot:GDKK01058219.1.p1 GENE.GDKK01058219.1~~GDKK01058219.1.p1  ORF type:complete len:367 (-),score=80.47 GDKK01058219.1:194-1294(-)